MGIADLRCLPLARNYSTDGSLQGSGDAGPRSSIHHEYKAPLVAGKPIKALPQHQTPSHRDSAPGG